MPDQIKLEYKFKKGEVFKYTSVIDSTNKIIQNDKNIIQSSTAKMDMDQTTKEINLDGTGTIEVKITKGTVTFEDKTENLPNVGQIVVMKMKKNGEIIETSVQVPFTQPTLPEKRIALKESWTGDSKISIPNKKEAITIKYNYQLVEFKNINNRECAVITLSTPPTEFEIEKDVIQKVEAKGFTYFDFNAGTLVKSEVETNAVIKSTMAEIETTSKIKLDLTEVSSSGSLDEGYIIK